MKSNNNTVNTISMMGVNGWYSVLGANYRVLSTKCGMNLNNIMKVLNERYANKEEIIRILMYILNFYLCVFLISNMQCKM